MGLETRKRGLEAGMAERRSEVEMQLQLMQVDGRGCARQAVQHGKAAGRGHACQRAGSPLFVVCNFPMRASLPGRR